MQRVAPGAGPAPQLQIQLPNAQRERKVGECREALEMTLVGAVLGSAIYLLVYANTPSTERGTPSAQVAPGTTFTFTSISNPPSMPFLTAGATTDLATTGLATTSLATIERDMASTPPGAPTRGRNFYEYTVGTRNPNDKRYRRAPSKGLEKLDKKTPHPRMTAEARKAQGTTPTRSKHQPKR